VSGLWGEGVLGGRGVESREVRNGEALRTKVVGGLAGLADWYLSVCRANQLHCPGFGSLQ
jgi:hypothetical protein